MIKVLSLVNEALLRLGKKDDTASATGSLHAKVDYLDALIDTLTNTTEKIRGVVASNNVKVSAITERSTSQTSPQKLKEIKIRVNGTVRVAFTMRASSDSEHFGRIYVNGSTRGLEGSSSSSSPRTFSEDINVDSGDRIQLYAWRGGNTTTVYVKDFTIGYDISTDDYSVITD